jgi:dipeptidyl aminopeptidase/acylaminoacyl peptidase
MLAFLSDADGWLNLWLADGNFTNRDGSNCRPLLKEEFEHGGPSWGPGQRSFAWSPDSRRIAFTRNESGFGRLCVLDVGSGEVSDLGKGGHGGLAWAGDSVIAVRSGATTPTQLVRYSPDRTLLARGPVLGFEAALVEPELVHWQGDDGGEVHGRLYTPRGAEVPPLLLWCHGGPTGQSPVDFIPRIAFYVDHGWAVLTVDYRGSTGWGRAYAQALQGRWGELDVCDCAAGMRAAAERGWGDPRRMVPIGGSAGGFTVLLLLALHPELCAAGVDLFGVADLLDLDETTHRFEQHYLHGVVGPLPETVDRYRERSPINLADRITSPLLILQGTDDPAVPVKQSKTIAETLQRLGRTVELQLYEGEGHGWSNPDVIKDELERTDDFLRRHVLLWRA